MQRLYWDTFKVNGQKVFFTLDGRGVNFVGTPGVGVSQVLDFYTNDKFEYAKSHDKTGRLVKTIKSYLKGRTKDLAIPIDFMALGSDNDRLAWNAIAQIPYGETVSLVDLANQVGLSPDDVERSISQSPIWLLLPLHRVTGLTNRYRGRVNEEINADLVDLEQHPKRELKDIKLKR